MKRVIQLIIGEDLTIGDRPALGGVAATNWNPGKIVILKNDFTEFVAADTAYDQEIYIARYDAVSTVKLSYPIFKKAITSYRYKAYAAGVKKKIEITVPIPSGAVGQQFGLFISNTSDKEILYNGRRLFDYATVSGDTAVEVVNALIALINADPNVNVVASVGTSSSKLALEAKTVYDFFEIGLTFDLFGATVASVATGAFGCGTYKEISDLENDYDLGYSGHLNRVLYPDVPTKYALANGTYGTFTIEHSQSQEDGMIGTTGFKSPVTTIVAVAAAEAAAFKTLLEIWLGVADDELPS